MQIARVGNSEKAKEFIHKLDVDPEIGGILDCVQGRSVGRSVGACALCANAVIEEGIERAEEMLTLDSDDTDHVDVWVCLTHSLDRVRDGADGRDR